MTKCQDHISQNYFFLRCVLTMYPRLDYVPQVRLKPPHPPPKCWDYSYRLPHLTVFSLFA